MLLLLGVRKNKMKIECDICNKELKRKEAIKLNHHWRCQDCQRKKKKEHREFLKREICHINKRSPNGTRKEYHYPKLKSSKRKSLPRSKFNYLTMIEKQILFKKYIKRGLDKESIKEKIKRDTKYLSDFIKELREKQIEEENISSRFKEEFAKLIN